MDNVKKKKKKIPSNSTKFRAWHLNYIITGSYKLKIIKLKEKEK